MHIHRIKTSAGASREIPLRGTGGRAGARSDETHNAALRASGGDIVPASIGSFDKIASAIVNDDAGGWLEWIIKRVARWIDLRAVIYKGRVGNPQRSFLVYRPWVCATALPAIRVNRSSGGVADK